MYDRSLSVRGGVLPAREQTWRGKEWEVEVSVMYVETVEERGMESAQSDRSLFGSTLKIASSSSLIRPPTWPSQNRPRPPIPFALSSLPSSPKTKEYPASALRSPQEPLSQSVFSSLTSVPMLTSRPCSIPQTSPRS